MTTSTGRETPTRLWIGLAVVLVAVLMGQIDMFAVTIAAPAIQGDLGASFGELQLIVGGYVVAYAAGLVTGGRLGDRYGRRRVFGLGVAGFTVASLLCGLAPSAGLLIAARVLQGVTASVLMPQVLSMIRANFDEPAQRRAVAVGAYGATIGLGVIAGLIGGGGLLGLDLFGLGWRSIFLLNIPIGLVVCLALRSTVEESRSTALPRLDGVGAVLAGLALVFLLLPLSLTSGTAWRPENWASLALGVALFAGFLGQQRSLERRGGEPIVPPRLFRGRGFPLSMAAVTAFYAGNAGLFLVLTYHLQSGLRLGPVATGLAFTPLGIGFAVASAAGKRLSGRFGTGTSVVGALAMAVSLAAVPAATGLPAASQAVTLAAIMGVSGLGQGLVVAALVSTVLGLVAADDAGAGSGVLNTVTQTSLALGVAVIGALYQAVLGGNPEQRVAGLGMREFAAAFDVVAWVLAGCAVVVAGLLHRLRSV